METKDEHPVETASPTPKAQGEEPGKAKLPEGALPLDTETERLVQWDQEELPEAHERTSERRASVMFFVAVAFLVIVGLMAGHGISGQANQFMFGWWLGGPLLALWGVIILEAMWGLVTVQDRHISAFKRFVLVVLLPPFRAAFAVAYPGRFVWVPRHGWLRVGRLNYERMELAIAIPMLAVTLVVLPLLAIELFLADWLEQHLWAAVVVHCLTALVWFAFALEFIVMLALAEKKLAYCKLHWINIAIIVLPLIAFLRVIRIFRFLRVGKASKLLRAYRMRGVVSRTMRLAMVFNLIDRLLERNPEKYLAALEEKLREKQTEIQVLEEKMEEMRRKIAEEKANQKEAEVNADATKPA
jgi:voltage-gated potassium channel